MSRVAKITPKIINALVINEMKEYDDYIAMQSIKYLSQEIELSDKERINKEIDGLKEKFYQIEGMMYSHINSRLLENISSWSGEYIYESNGNLSLRNPLPPMTMNMEYYSESITSYLRSRKLLNFHKISNKLLCELHEHFSSNSGRLVKGNTEYFNNSFRFFYSKCKGVDYTDEDIKLSIKNNLHEMYFYQYIFNKQSKEELYMKSIDYMLHNEKLLQYYSKDLLLEAKTYVEKEIITNQIESIKNDTPTKRRRI